MCPGKKARINSLYVALLYHAAGVRAGRIGGISGRGGTRLSESRKWNHHQLLHRVSLSVLCAFLLHRIGVHVLGA